MSSNERRNYHWLQTAQVRFLTLPVMRCPFVGRHDSPVNTVGLANSLLRLEQGQKMDRMEQRLYALDKNIGAFLREMLYVKDRVNEMEATRELRH